MFGPIKQAHLLCLKIFFLKASSFKILKLMILVPIEISKFWFWYLLNMFCGLVFVLINDICF